MPQGTPTTVAPERDLETRARLAGATCSTPGCEKHPKSRGLCSTHYNRTQPDRHKKIRMPCAKCGADCMKAPTQARRYGNVFCTEQCRSDFIWADNRAAKKQVAAYKPRPLWHAAHENMPKAMAAPNRTFKTGRCVICNAWFTCPFGSRACGDECQAEWDKVRRDDYRQRRRARERNAYVAPVNRWRIFERDAWMCQLCHQPLARAQVAPHPLAPTIDHVIPLAKGGTHEPGNTQAAHFICNSTKGDRADWHGTALMLAQQ